MFIVLIRTVLLYCLVIFVIRLMGKRQIGELQPYEFVITLMVSDLASIPMQDTRLPLILSIIPIITLLFIKILLSVIQLKSQKARRWLEGEPSILIAKGKINFENLKEQQINLDELMEELRLAGYFDLRDVEYAILENNGQISFLETDKKKGDKLPIIYILDGKINNNNLTSSGKSREWILKKIREKNINSIEDIIIAMENTDGSFFYQLYDKETKA